jgi:DNA primase
MAPPGDFAQNLKQQADIVRVIGEYVKLKKTGAQNYTGLCPFHSEKTGSFSVHATRQFYHCFGCGASGDVFTFIQKIENITFPEAVRALAQRLGVPVPKLKYSSEEEARQAGLRAKLLEINERACAFFQEQLRRAEGAHAREYLAGRGLNEEMIARFRIGYAPDSGFLLKDVLKREFDEEVQKASGLFSWKEPESRQPSASSSQPSAVSDQPKQTPGENSDDSGPSTRAEALARDDKQESVRLYSKFRNRVMFPICNEAGRVIAFTGRTLATDEKSGPKYLNSPETAIYSKSRVLFNLHLAKEAIRKLEYAILVEGQMDCISVFAAGYQNVIASSGTAFTEHQARLLGRFTHQIVVNFDPDAAGAAAAERSLGMLVENDFSIKVITLEAGFDPDLFVRKRGAAAYAAALRASQKYLDYLIERARVQFPVRTPEGKVKAVNFLLPHIQRVPSRIVRDELANEIAQKLAIDSAVLRQELKHAATRRGQTELHAPVAQVTPAERILIRGLLSEFCEQARSALAAEKLHEGLATESLLEVLLAAEQPDIAVLASEPDRQLAAGVLLNEHEELTPELLEGALGALRARKLKRRQQELTGLIGEAERRQDSSTLAKLLQEKVEIRRAMARQGAPAD